MTEMPKSIWADDSRESARERAAHYPYGVWWIGKRAGYTLYHRDDAVQELAAALREAAKELDVLGSITVRDRARAALARLEDRE